MTTPTGGDGRPGPDEQLMRIGHALRDENGCIAQARDHAAAFLDSAGTDHQVPVSDRTRDLTQLVVSELVTNSRKYAPGPILMELRLTTRAVEVVVWDSDPTVPEARTADPARIGQHGLEIVKAIAEGFFVEQEPVGKRITARIALTDLPTNTDDRRDPGPVRLR